MTAPVASTRLPPTGVKLGSGYQTFVTFASQRAANFWEKSVTPPGLEVQEAIDTTTMHNTTWRTKHNRALIEMGMFSMTAGYAPGFYSTGLSLINYNDTVTVRWPEASTLAFYGFMKSFKPGPLEEQTFPEATVEVEPTNADPTTCAEESPVYTAGPGTGHC